VGEPQWEIVLLVEFELSLPSGLEVSDLAADLFLKEILSWVQVLGVVKGKVPVRFTQRTFAYQRLSLYQVSLIDGIKMSRNWVTYYEDDTLDLPVTNLINVDFIV